MRGRIKAIAVPECSVTKAFMLALLYITSSNMWGEKERRGRTFSCQAQKGVGMGNNPMCDTFETAQKIPTVAQNSTKNRGFAKSDLA